MPRRARVAPRDDRPTLFLPKPTHFVVIAGFQCGCCGESDVVAARVRAVSAGAAEAALVHKYGEHCGSDEEDGELYVTGIHAWPIGAFLEDLQVVDPYAPPLTEVLKGLLKERTDGAQTRP